MNGLRWVDGPDRHGTPHDEGLQAERTAMAWQRTALGLGGVSALLLHDIGGSLLAALPGLLGLGVATLLLVLSELRYEQTVRRVASGRHPAAAGQVLMLAVTIVGLAVLAICLILVEVSP